MRPYLFTAIPLFCLFSLMQNNEAMKRPSATQTCEEDVSDKACVPFPISNELLNQWRNSTASTNFKKALDRIAQGDSVFILTDVGWFIDSEINCMISIFPHITTVALDNYDILPAQMVRLIEALKHNGRVVTLSLKNTNTGYESAGSISDMLQHNDTLKKLYLSHNHIGARGARLICEGIQNNPNSALIELNLRYNQISLKDTLAIYSPLIKLRPGITLYSEYPEICATSATPSAPKERS